MWAKQSTAATLIVGPVLDSAGAEYTSAVIGDLSISKNGGTLTALAAAATLNHIANGQYTLVLTTGNLDTLGRAQITCNKSTYQMPPVNLQVVPANTYDSLVAGSDALTVDVTQISGDATAADNLESACDNYSATRGLAGTALPAAAADAAGGLPISDAGGLDLDARLDAAISSRMATYTQPTGFLAATFPTTVASPTNITAGTITTVTNLTNAPTSGDFTATMKASITAAVPTAGAISTQVASDLATAHGAGSWATATGFSTHSAADVWTSGTRTLSAFGFDVTLADAVTHGGATAVFQGSFVGDVTGNISGSVGSLGAQAKLDVNAEVDTAFSDNMPASFATQWPLVYQTEVTGITTDVEAAAGKHSVAGAMMMQTNGSVAAGVWTARKPSDDTVFATYIVTTDANAKNITGVS